mmetsp:Transcript_5424/g.9483  ORF Transcript_5424/g.9483 Transcript_5424/m.9483 type:complete len:152 (-) Transcript_5424:467-922(-)
MITIIATHQYPRSPCRVFHSDPVMFSLYYPYHHHPPSHSAASDTFFFFSEKSTSGKREQAPSFSRCVGIAVSFAALSSSSSSSSALFSQASHRHLEVANAPNKQRASAHGFSRSLIRVSGLREAQSGPMPELLRLLSKSDVFTGAALGCVL